jgi:hypothetical protein
MQGSHWWIFGLAKDIKEYIRNSVFLCFEPIFVKSGFCVKKIENDPSERQIFFYVLGM